MHGGSVPMRSGSSRCTSSSRLGVKGSIGDIIARTQTIRMSLKVAVGTSSKGG